jgi:hypothetical protein
VDGEIVKLSVDCRIFSEDLKKKVEKSLRRNMPRYWYPFVAERSGRMGHLCSGDVVMFVQGNPSDIAETVQPRTSPSVAPVSRPKPGVQPPHEKDWLTQLQNIEPSMEWGPFEAQIARGKMIHVVTDGGARRNPGNAG